MDKKRIGAVAVVCLLVCSAAQAGLVLDQFQQDQTGWVAFRQDVIKAQTFTPDVSGVLGRVELGNTRGDRMVDATPPIVEIYNTTVGGQPGSTLLGSGVALDPIPVDGWVGIDLLSESIYLTSGVMYAIVIHPLDTEKWVTVGKNDDPDSYGPGAWWSYSESSPTWEIESRDIQFRTYMDAPVVPVPGAAMLGMIGMATAGWLKRRRAL